MLTDTLLSEKLLCDTLDTETDVAELEAQTSPEHRPIEWEARVRLLEWTCEGLLRQDADTEIGVVLEEATLDAPDERPDDVELARTELEPDWDTELPPTELDAHWLAVQ